MFLLSHVGPQTNHVAAWGSHRTANCHAADLLRSRDVPIEQRRREIPNGDIIETVTRLVDWQQCFDVDLK
ncbi:MAG: hypothetical protein R3B91_14990 [Planctomycetaceae bacterium]